MAAREPGADTKARRAALLDMLGGARCEESGQSQDTVEFAVEALVALKQDRSCSVSVGSLGAVTSRRHSSCVPLNADHQCGAFGGAFLPANPRNQMTSCTTCEL